MPCMSCLTHGFGCNLYLQFDFENRTLPILDLPDAPGVSVVKSGKFVTVRTSFGLVVKFDGRSKTDIMIPDVYKNV